MIVKKMLYFFYEVPLDQAYPLSYNLTDGLLDQGGGGGGCQNTQKQIMIKVHQIINQTSFLLYKAKLKHTCV